MSAFPRHSGGGNTVFCFDPNSCKVLGHGAFGRVYAAKGRSPSNRNPILHETAAIKAIEKRNEVDRDRARNESDILARLQGHPNIVRMSGVIEDDRMTYIIMERCPGGNLAEVLDCFRFQHTPEAVLKEIALQVLNAIRHCRDSQVVHGDVKPENFCSMERMGDVYDFRNSEFFRPWTIKVIDMGSAQTFDKLLDARLRGLKRMKGTPLYMSPEVLIPSRRQTNESDVWSLGVMLFFLATRVYPFGEVDSVAEGEDGKDGGPILCPSSSFEPLQVAHHSHPMMRHPHHQRLIMNASFSGVRRMILHRPIELGPLAEKVFLDRDYSPQFMDFVQSCLKFDVEDRMTIDESQEHPWLCTNTNTNTNFTKYGRRWSKPQI